MRVLWEQYVHKKQSYEELAKRYGISERTVRRQIDKVKIFRKDIGSGDAVIAMDTTYFGRGFGVMVFRNVYSSRNLFWKFVRHETLEEYVAGIGHLVSNGWNILGIACDGKRGLFSAFGNTPIQMCQFHQVAIITRYTTTKPKLDAGKELREISLNLRHANKEQFISHLKEWHKKWEAFLSEKTRNPETKRWFYTHRRLRSAYRSLKTNLIYLFTYLEHPELKIPNTTNSLEGVFSNLKTKIRVHAGLKIHRKIKIINELLDQ